MARKLGISGKAHNRPSLIAGQSNLTRDIPSNLLAFNFKFLDQTQGQTIEDWGQCGLLPEAFEVFRCYSSQYVPDAYGDRFKCYKGFPTHSEFSHPRHVPEDAIWASMHLRGKPCVIGHMHENVFYVVFLDKDHRFYPTDIQDR